MVSKTGNNYQFDCVNYLYDAQFPNKPSIKLDPLIPVKPITIVPIEKNSAKCSERIYGLNFYLSEVVVVFAV